MNKIKRVLIKLSGEALEDKKDNRAYNTDILNEIGKTIKQIKEKGVDVCLVVGGGNIFRGKEAPKLGLDKIEGDYMGMLATIINGIALKNVLANYQVEAKVFSALNVDKCVINYTISKAKKFLNEGKVLIFVGGIGHPFFTTDTCAALRAKEMNCDAILMAKNGVDGIYDDDPRINKKAKFIPSLTYNDIINKKLQVMDLTSASLLLGSKINSYVFNIDNPSNAIKIISGEKVGSIITD